MAGLTRTLPQSVYVQLDAKQAQGQLNSILYQANQGLTTLHDLKNDLGAIPERLKDITIKWLDDVLLARIEAVKQMPLPQGTISSMISSWQDIKEKAIEAIRAIQSVLEVVPVLNCRIEEGQIICVNAVEWVKEKATYIIPSKYKEHYRLVGNVIETANKLRYYEKRNGLKSFPVEILINSILSVDDYTRFIVDGTFEKEMSQEQFNRLYHYELSRL